MTDKYTTKQQTDLLSARKNALEKARVTLIQPRGKFNGFDVFSWLDAPMEELYLTLSSMPFPIHWVVSSELLAVFSSNGYTDFPNVHSIYVTGDVSLMPLGQDFESVSSVHEVISKSQFLNSKGTLIFTLTGAQGIDWINDLTFCLKTIQGS